MPYKTRKELSDLEKEHNHLKSQLCEKFTKFMIVMFLITSVIELVRAISFAQMSIIVVPTIAIISALILLWLMNRYKGSDQECVITVFNIATYSLSLYGHHSGSGYFNNTSDTFYFAYSYALLERIVFDRVPSASYKTILYVLAILVRPLIIPLHDMGLFFIQCFFIATTIYFEFDQEKHYKTLFGSYFHSKEQLGKFKDLVENYIPEAIIVVTRDSMESLFMNNAFNVLFDTKRKLDLRTQLDSFYLRESLTSSHTLDFSSFKSFQNLNRTLLNILENRASEEQDATPKARGTCHFGFKKDVSDQETKENKVFEAKILDIIWDDIPAFAIVLHDITQQQTILQLKIAADLNKDRVLATVSHELRTPLNGILGMIQIMFKKIQDQELLQYLKICKNSANLLIGLVNSILDLNQIRFNKFRLSQDKVNIHDLLRDIVSLFEYQCVQKNISLKLQISSQVPKTIITDKNRLSQIFINLVGNALKFTVRGGITITAKESRHPEMIEFSVEDTGMGIRREDRDKLFMMYGRLDQDDKKVNQQGVGLGLTISNSLAQILCGDDGLGGIKVESEYGKGSAFTFLVRKVLFTGSLVDTRLEVQDTYPSVTESFFVEEAKGIDLKVKAYQMPPLKKNPGGSGNVVFSAPHSPRSAITMRRKEPISILGMAKFNTENAMCSKKDEPTILIVDDNPFNITVASYLVSSQGFHVKSALYGQAAIQIMLKNDHKTEPIRLVLMDCLMPVMDGYETTRNLIRLMKEGKIPKIPIVALTANNSTADREECQNAGMCDYLHKPLTEANLVKILKKYSCKY